MPNVLWTLFAASEESCPVVHRERELPVLRHDAAGRQLTLLSDRRQRL